MHATVCGLAIAKGDCASGFPRIVSSFKMDLDPAR